MEASRKPDMEKVIKGLEQCLKMECRAEDCPYYYEHNPQCTCINHIEKDALALLKEQEKEIKALHLLVEWAEECDFGFDQFPIEYERYKDEIKGMKYTDGMIYIAKRTLEDHGVFEKGR